MILVDISGAGAAIRKQEALTCGMVGANVRFRFDEAWDGLAKTAVFRAGKVTRDAVMETALARIPHEVLTVPGVPLEIGVYGTDSGGSLVIPTVWARTQPVQPGADPSGDPGTDPSLPVWAQLQEQVTGNRQSITALQTRLATLTLPASGWVGSGSLWAQTAAPEGVTETSQVNLLPSLSQLAGFRDSGLSFLTENDGGTVTVYALGQKPEEDITIHASIAEVRL